jgi:hypothetical protein
VGGFRGDGTNPTGELLNKHTISISARVNMYSLTRPFIHSLCRQIRTPSRPECQRHQELAQQLAKSTTERKAPANPESRP